MKSTFDAVNEFKGGNLSNLIDSTEWSYKHKRVAGNDLGSFTYMGITICTFKQYAALIEEMKLGLDVNKVTHGEFFDYVNGDKQLLESITSRGNVQSGYTGLKDGDFVVIKGLPDKTVNELERAATNRGFVSCFVCKKPLIMYISDGKVRKADTKSNLTNELTASQWVTAAQSNIYTQEMANSGVLPSVGMECLFKESGYVKKGIVTARTVEFIIITSKQGLDDKEFIRKNSSWIKPVRPPVSLIDGKAYQFKVTLPNKIETLEGIFRGTNNSLNSAYDCYCVSDCTNIEPLTVVSK